MKKSGQRGGNGARVSYHAPLVPVFSVDGFPLRSAPLSPKTLSSADCVVIITDHDGVDYPHVVRHSRVILDTRNTLRRLGGTWPARKVIRL